MSPAPIVLNFGFGRWTTEFTFGFGGQTTVLNFGLGSRTIAVTSWRSESSNISLVVLDNISRSLFLKNWKKEDRQTDRQTDGHTDRQTDGQDLPIKSPRRRLKKV